MAERIRCPIDRGLEVLRARVVSPDEVAHEVLHDLKTDEDDRLVALDVDVRLDAKRTREPCNGRVQVFLFSMQRERDGRRPGVTLRRKQANDLAELVVERNRP